MTISTPEPTIKVKVLGLAWRGDELLVSKVEDSSGRVKGVRPLGGRIEFGETREQALVREFEEELGCAVTVTGEWHGLESIYEHEGAVGHEFVFAANIELGDSRFYSLDRFPYLKSDETNSWALWLAPDALSPGVELYPAGLQRLVREGLVGPKG